MAILEFSACSSAAARPRSLLRSRLVADAPMRGCATGAATHAHGGRLRDVVAVELLTGHVTVNGKHIRR
jgi:hypothetical protein